MDCWIGLTVRVAMRAMLDKKELLRAVLKDVKPANILLDIGCGIRPQQLIKPAVQICCEPFEQYAKVLLDMVQSDHDRQLCHDRHYVVVRATWAEVVKLFPARSVDTVCLLDVIEHLEKEEGRRLLKATEALARQQVVVFTPLGFMLQKCPDGKDGWGLDGGEWQEHRSGWLPEDFDRSWNTYACSDFHATDSLGKPLAQAVGAFWAVKTMRNDSGRTGSTHGVKHSRRQKAHILVDEAINLVSRLKPH